MSFEASVRYSGDIAILDLAGRIVLNDGSATMREAIAKLREAGSSKILLNLADVSFIDSSGLGELASAFAATQQSRRPTEAGEHPGAHYGSAAHHQAGQCSHLLPQRARRPGELQRRRRSLNPAGVRPPADCD